MFMQCLLRFVCRGRRFVGYPCALSSFQLFLELLVTEQGRAVVHVHQEYPLPYNDLC
jgi:hypothetical protein